MLINLSELTIKCLIVIHATNLKIHTLKLNCNTNRKALNLQKAKKIFVILIQAFNLFILYYLYFF